MGARDLLAELRGDGFEVLAHADRLVIRPAARLTDDLRGAIRSAKPELLALLHGAVVDVPAQVLAHHCKVAAVAFYHRRARLLRWGWPAADAERMAERLALRDSDDDERVTCAVDCAHYRPGRCGNHRAADLATDVIGRELASLLQRCPGFGSASEPVR